MWNDEWEFRKVIRFGAGADGNRSKLCDDLTLNDAT